MNKASSLRKKLMMAVLLATLSALAVANGIFLVYDIISYHTARTNDLQAQIELLSEVAVAPLEFNDQAVERKNLEPLRLRPTVNAAAIYDARGVRFADYSRNDAHFEFPTLPSGEGIQVNFGSSSMVITKRIISDGHILGTAYLNAEYAMAERIGNYVAILSLVALAAMGVAFLVYSWLVSPVIQPILAIVDVSRKVVAEKNYALRAEKISADEVGDLADAFNDMLTVIEGRRVALETSNRELEQEITERNRAQETIQQLNAELEEKVQERTQQLQATNQELESFCYSVSHDLRGPLRSISGFSQALVEELPVELPGDSKRYLDKIFAATTRMGQLIEDLLNLSRVSRGELVRQQMSLSDLAWQVISELRNREPNYQVDVSVWDEIQVDADPKLLHIVLENLLGNAWKFSSKQDKPKVVVGLMKDGTHEVCFIRDNGAGFDMQYADKLFGAFQRLHAMHEYPGTGIGLATVQRIIHRHGGKIWVDAAPGKGAAFYFTLKHDSRGQKNESSSAAA